MKADPEPPEKLRKLDPERQKLQKTAKGISPACVLPVGAPLPAVKQEEPATAVKQEKKEPDGLGLTWESF